MNRAFRAAVRRILAAVVPGGDDLSGVLTWVLRHATERRLVEAGVTGAPLRSALDLEPDLGDGWYAYLALAPETVIRDLIEEGGLG